MPLSAALHAPGAGGGFRSTESISNIRSSGSHFSNLINQLRAAQPNPIEEPEAEDILRVIEQNLGGVELVESAAMGDLRREGEGGSGLESYFRGLVGVVCGDTLGLIPLE